MNSPLFDGVTSWVEFKELMRLKFRGTFSSTDFFRHLNNYKLAAGQAPADYFVSVETTVFQGVRDYPRSLSCPEEVIRCIFLQGLPSWLGEAIILKEESLLPELVEVAQKCWGFGTLVSRNRRMPLVTRTLPRILRHSNLDLLAPFIRVVDITRVIVARDLLSILLQWSHVSLHR